MHGFQQFYGQDTITPAFPYDFTVDPDGLKKGRNNLPVAANFFFYNKIGNIAFIGFSNAHAAPTQQKYFDEACTWASQSNPASVVLLGHWNEDGLGCDANSSVPSVANQLIMNPLCSSIKNKLTYFVGHTHCNEVVIPDIGFMIGAQGMSDTSCQNEFGFSIVDTTANSFKVYYFPLQVLNKYDHYNVILECIRANGISGCYHMAELWSNQPF